MATTTALPASVQAMVEQLSLELPDDFRLWQDAHHSPHREFVQLPPGLYRAITELAPTLSGDQMLELVHTVDTTVQVTHVRAYRASADYVLGRATGVWFEQELRDYAVTALLVLLADYLAERQKDALGIRH